LERDHIPLLKAVAIVVIVWTTESVCVCAADRAPPGVDGVWTSSIHLVTHLHIVQSSVCHAAKAISQHVCVDVCSRSQTTVRVRVAQTRVECHRYVSKFTETAISGWAARTTERC